MKTGRMGIDSTHTALALCVAFPTLEVNMILQLFGAFDAGRRRFLHSFMAVTLGAPLATKANTLPVLDLNGFQFGPPKFKIGDRVKHQWINELDDQLPIEQRTVTQEGLIVGYYPNIDPNTWYEKKYAGQWAYHIYWLMSTLEGDREGIDCDCSYFEDELKLVSPASVSIGV